MQRPPIGELFVQLKLLTPDEVASVLKRMQKSDTGRFGSTALELNLVDHEGAFTKSPFGCWCQGGHVFRGGCHHYAVVSVSMQKPSAE